MSKFVTGLILGGAAVGTAVSFVARRETRTFAQECEESTRALRHVTAALSKELEAQSKKVERFSAAFEEGASASEDGAAAVNELREHLKNAVDGGATLATRVSLCGREHIKSVSDSDAARAARSFLGDQAEAFHDVTPAVLREVEEFLRNLDPTGNKSVYEDSADEDAGGAKNPLKVKPVANEKVKPAEAKPGAANNTTAAKPAAKPAAPKPTARKPAARKPAATGNVTKKVATDAEVAAKKSAEAVARTARAAQRRAAEAMRNAADRADDKG